MKHEFAHHIAQDAQKLRSAQTISSDAKERQSFFEREMELTCRDSDFANFAEDTGTMRFANAVKTVVDGAHDAIHSNDRSGLSGTRLG